MFMNLLCCSIQTLSHVIPCTIHTFSTHLVCLVVGSLVEEYVILLVFYLELPRSKNSVAFLTKPEKKL